MDYQALAVVAGFALIYSLAAGQTDAGQAAGLVVELPLKAIGIGALVGITEGVPVSEVLEFCTQRKWVSATWLQIPVIAWPCCVLQRLSGWAAVDSSPVSSQA